METFGIWLAAAMTIGIISFLYKDNVFYKASEAIFVGVSAGYWFVTYYWDNLYRKAWLGIQTGDNWDRAFLYMALVLGVMMLTRLFNKIGWLSRWPLAFIVGATAGLYMMAYFVSNAFVQIGATITPPAQIAEAGETSLVGIGAIIAAVYLVIIYVIFRGINASSMTDTGRRAVFGLVILVSIVLALAAGAYYPAHVNFLFVATGTFCGLVYFFFSKEHRGAFGGAAKLGIWFLMITFGASFGYTVMSRMSLMLGRLDFLFGSWLQMIK